MRGCSVPVVGKIAYNLVVPNEVNCADINPSTTKGITILMTTDVDREKQLQLSTTFCEHRHLVAHIKNQQANNYNIAANATRSCLDQ